MKRCEGVKNRFYTDRLEFEQMKKGRKKEKVYSKIQELDFATKIRLD
jgi:hypothetical protein